MQNDGFTFIEPTAEIPKKPLFAVIAGFPGLGKTSLSFTAPGVVMVFDADLGIERAVQKKRPLATRVTDYGKFKEFIFSDGFKEMISARGIRSICFDTVGALLDDVITPFIIRGDSKNSRAGGLSLQGYGALKQEFSLLLSRLFTLGVNVIGVCHAKEEGDDATAVKQLRLSVTGGSNEIILRKADMLGFITMRRGKRTLDFNPSDYQIGKNTAQLPPMDIPEATTPDYDSFLSGLFDKTYARMSEFSEAQNAAIKVQGDFTDRILALTSPEGFPDLLAEIALLPSEMMRAALMQTATARFVEILAESRFEKAKTPKQFTEVLLDLGKNPVAEVFKKPVWIKLTEIAKSRGLGYNPKTKEFEAAEAAPAPPATEPAPEEKAPETSPETEKKEAPEGGEAPVPPAEEKAPETEKKGRGRPKKNEAQAGLFNNGGE